MSTNERTNEPTNNQIDYNYNYIIIVIGDESFF
jgi:hypothetical protein